MQVAEGRLAVGWWPDCPLEAPLGRLGQELPAECVFPSGRAAIAQFLQAADLAGDTAIAVAGYGSDCLTRIVRRFGIPVDILELAPSVGAVVVYEQWGWPLSDAAWTALAARCTGRLLVRDRVDSADFFIECLPRAVLEDSVEVLSLSKLLGLSGGGLARRNGCLIKFQPQPASDVVRSLQARPLAVLARGGYRELFKESRQAVHPAVLAWLQHNSLARAAEIERIARQRHLRGLLGSSLAAGWPAWMRQAIDRGAGPVWAPVLRDQDATWQWRAMRTLDQRFGVVSAPRLFNWSGDPLRPEYEICLALPVHGGVTEFGEIVAALE